MKHDVILHMRFRSCFFANREEMGGVCLVPTSDRRCLPVTATLLLCTPALQGQQLQSWKICQQPLMAQHRRDSPLPLTPSR